MIQQNEPNSNNQNDINHQQSQQKKLPPPQKVQHPNLNYSVTQVYMIRKQSIAHSNDLIVKRLSRCFQKIKKFKSGGRQKQLYREYDQQISNVRKSWKRVHDLFKMGSKTPEITQKKIDKMKARIDKVKKDINQDQTFLTKDLDINKIYIRTVHSYQQSQQGTSNQQLNASSQKLLK